MIVEWKWLINIRNGIVVFTIGSISARRINKVMHYKFIDRSFQLMNIIKDLNNNILPGVLFNFKLNLSEVVGRKTKTKLYHKSSELLVL